MSPESFEAVDGSDLEKPAGKSVEEYWPTEWAMGRGEWWVRVSVKERAEDGTGREHQRSGRWMWEWAGTRPGAEGMGRAVKVGVAGGVAAAVCLFFIGCA